MMQVSYKSCGAQPWRQRTSPPCVAPMRPRPASRGTGPAQAEPIDAALRWALITQRRSRMADASTQDAIALLKADHRTVEDLFERFEAAKGAGKKQALAEQICRELTIHAKIEERRVGKECRSRWSPY